MSGIEEEVVLDKGQQQAAVHVDKLRSEDETLVEVRTIDHLQHHIGIERFHFFAVVNLNPVDIHLIGTTGDGLAQCIAEF